MTPSMFLSWTSYSSLRPLLDRVACCVVGVCGMIRHRLTPIWFGERPYMPIPHPPCFRRAELSLALCVFSGIHTHGM